MVEQMETETIKRKNTSGFGEDNSKKPRKVFDRTGKNSLQVLFYEFKKNNEPIDFQFESIGTVQSPSYKALVELEGVWFEGVGPSKMMAKRLLASKALAQLRSIFISPDYPDKEMGAQDNTYVLQTLNKEFNNGRPVDYQFECTTGASGLPSHKAIAVVEGVTFEGVGISKAAAKKACAANALAKLKGEPKPLMDFSAGTYNNPFNFNNAPLANYTIPKKQQQLTGLPALTAQVFGSQYVSSRPKVDVEKARSHPYMVLTEMYPNLQLEWADGHGKGEHRYKVEAVVSGVTFYGEGRSKKLAKFCLAKSVLLCLHDVTGFKEATDDDTNDETTEKLPKKKFCLTQLKEIVGEDGVSLDIVKQEGADEASAFLATVVARGVAYEAVGKTKFTAKIKAAKKALDVLQPKKEVDVNHIDVNHHPNKVFQDQFKNVRLNETENVKEGNTKEYSLETTIQGRKFRTSASNKKKAKLQLVLKVFEVLRNIQPSQWTSIDLNEINA